MYSADGGPEQLMSSKLDGSDRKVLLGDNFASVGGVLWAPHHRALYAATLAVGRPHFAALDDSATVQVQQALSAKFPDEAIDVARKATTAWCC